MAPNRNLVYWILLIWRFCTCLGNLNLYLNGTETRRLLGIDAELFYVRNGIINNYALSFDIPIQSEVRDIYFTWQRVSQTPPSHMMHYNISTWVSNPRAMALPIPSIPREGAVPTDLSAFRIRLPCTGTMDAEVEVKITLNINIFFSNYTTILIRRKKVCLKDFIDHNHVEINPNEGNVSYIFPRETQDAVMTTSTNVFYIAVGCACGLILLIALSVIMCYVWSQRAGRSDPISKASSSQTLTHQGPTFLRADTPNNSVVGLPNVRRGFSPVVELKTEDVRTILGEIQIERNRVSLGEVIMEGTFGRIFHGHIITEDEKDVEQEIYAKTVTDQARLDQIETMMRESCVMKGFCHPNVNPIIASCMTDDYEPLLIFPFSSEGNLKKFLQKCKMSDITSHQVLNTQQLVYMAIQIIRGVQYMHKRRVVHRDLAIRNCVIDSNLVVKVTDNALSRDLFPNDYHCLGDNENRPVKWLAIESLLERRFSPASDVWAFGVTLWELMTLGQQPYADIDPFEMASYLKEGYRISQPINCPDELFAVMACCWALAPEERPKFSQLLVCLQDFYTALGRFI